MLSRDAVSSATPAGRSLIKLESQARPEKTLKKAIEEFRATLGEAQKKEFDRIKKNDNASASELCEVLRCTSELDQKRREKRLPGTTPHRLISVLQKIRDYSGGVDIIVGSSQSIIVGSVWGVIKTALQLCCNHFDFFDQLADLLLRVGRECPDYQQFARLFPESTELERRLCEYLIGVVHLCRDAIKLLNKPRKAIFADFNRRFGPHEKTLKLQAKDIRREVRMLDMKRNQDQREDKAKSKEEARIKSFLNACSDYDAKDTFRRILSMAASRWIQDMPEYNQWKASQSSSILWCEGKLGSGKSVIAANLVQDILTNNQSSSPPQVSYFFCRFDEDQSKQARTILGSLAKQLLQPHLQAPSTLKFEEGHTLQPDDILISLERMLPSNPDGYHIIIDGLDQCNEHEVSKMLQWLKKLLKIPLVFRIYLTVRSVQLRALKTSLHPQWTVHVSNQRPEIAEYIDVELQLRQESGTLNFGNENLMKEIRSELLRKCDGMFLWVKLQLDRLCKQRTTSELRRCLGDLPKDLENTYNQILQDLSDTEYPNHSEFCRKIFSIIGAAMRPLTLGELREVLAVRPSDHDLDEDELPSNMLQALEQLGSLVVYDQVSLTVHFTHHTARDHVFGSSLDPKVDSYRVEKQASDMLLGALCVTYLNFRRFGMQVEKIEENAQRPAVPGIRPVEFAIKSVTQNSAPYGQVVGDIAKLLHKYRGGSRDLLAFNTTQNKETPLEEEFEDRHPFHSYASENWLRHTRHFHYQTEPLVHKGFLTLVDGNVSKIALPWSPEHWEKLKPKFVTWIIEHHHIALLDFVADKLLNEHFHETEKRFFLKAIPGLLMQSVQERKFFGKVLQLAIQGHDQDLVNQLITTEVIDFNGGGGMSGNILQAACEAGQQSLVRTLIQRGASVNAGGGFYGSPLQAAAKGGHTQIVRILANAGANVNIVGGLRGTPLAAAAASSNTFDLMQLLIDLGADPNLIDEKAGTPLQAAASTGNINAIKYLLDHGANINAVGGIDGTALNAAFRNHEDVDTVKFLLQNNANIHIAAGEYGTALQAAAAHGKLLAVEYLLDCGADVNYCNPENLPAIAAAAYGNHKEIVRFLCEHGADVNLQGDSDQSGNALGFAAMENHIDIAKILIQYGALVTRPDLKHQPLYKAALWNHPDMVELLLAHGASVDASHLISDSDSHSSPIFEAALSAGSLWGDTQCAEILLRHGADVNFQGGRFNNALFKAVCFGRKDMVALLLDHGAEICVTAEDGSVWDALAEARNRGFQEIVETIEDYCKDKRAFVQRTANSF